MTITRGLSPDDPLLQTSDGTAYRESDGTFTLYNNVGDGGTGGGGIAPQPPPTAPGALTEQTVTDRPLIDSVPLAAPQGTTPGQPSAAIPAARDLNEVRLLVRGKSKTGWRSILILRGIEIMPSQFSIALTDRYSGDASQDDIVAGDTCQVMIGDTLILTGRIDRVRRKIGKRGLELQIVGRSSCRELVDCAIDPDQVPNMQIAQSTVLQITTKLAAIYGIDVHALGGAGDTIIPQFNLNLGDPAYPVIDSMARYAQILVYDDTDGSLNLAPVGAGEMASGFAEGVNIEEADFETGMDQRFSDYAVYMTSTYSLSDLAPLPPPLVLVKDPTVAQFRKHIIISEQHQLDPMISQQRGVWEMVRRYGRSNVLRLTTDSWRDKGGTLWQPNKLVQVTSPHMKLAGVKWLIAQVAFRRDAGGTHADLVIMPPAAFKPEPIVLVPQDAEISAARTAAGP